MQKVQQVSNNLTKRLMYEIREGIFAGYTMLPPEVDMATLFDVSRNVLRECLTCLEREGWITRKHGVGTLINRQAVRLKNRLDQTCGIKQSLVENGKTTDSDLVSVEHLTATEEVAQKLEIRVGDPVLCVKQVFLGDGKPAIFCVDYIPERSIQNKAYDTDDLRSSIFDFLKQFCGISDIETFITEVRALPATKEEAEALHVPQNTPLLFLGETGYTLRSNPVIYSRVLYLDGVVNHTVIRKLI